MMSETDRIEYKQHLTTDIAKFGIAQLGFGIPKVLQFYGRDCFELSDNFLRMKFPALDVTPHDTPHVSVSVLKLLKVLNGEMHRDKITEKLGLSDRKNLGARYNNPALEAEMIAYTLADTIQDYQTREALREQKS